MKLETLRFRSFFFLCRCLMPMLVVSVLLAPATRASAWSPPIDNGTPPKVSAAEPAPVKTFGNQKGELPRAQPQWWRGNLHTHTLWSDGDSFPELVVSKYKKLGYNFLVLSDHNVLSQGQKWVNPLKNGSARGHGHEILRHYLQEYGLDWVETRIVDTPFHDWLYSRPGGREHRPEPGEIAKDDHVVRLKPLNEFRALFEEPGRFLLIQGEEITDRPRTIHFNAINSIAPILPQGATAETADDTIRFNLAAVNAQSSQFGRPMLMTLNHPNFMWAVSAEDMAAVPSLRFFEVFNGGMEENKIRRDGRHSGADWGDATHPGTERMWDIALTLRLVAGHRDPLYGVASDDSHEHSFSPEIGRSIAGRGWLIVRASRLTPENLVHAMDSGDFYASTGVTLTDIHFDGRTIAIAIAGRPDATYRTEFIGTRQNHDATITEVKNAAGQSIATRYSSDIGQALATETSLNPSYTMRGDELYVRAVVTSSEPPLHPRKSGELMQAWVQPVIPPSATLSDIPANSDGTRKSPPDTVETR